MSTSCQISIFQLFRNIFVFASTICCQCCIIFDHIVSSTKKVGSHIFKFEKIQVLFSSPKFIKIKLSPMSTSCQILDFQLFQNICVFASTIFCQCCIIFDHIISCTIKVGSHIFKFEKIQVLFSSPKIIKIKLTPPRTFVSFCFFSTFSKHFCFCLDNILLVLDRIIQLSALRLAVPRTKLLASLD